MTPCFIHTPNRTNEWKNFVMTEEPKKEKDR